MLLYLISERCSYYFEIVWRLKQLYKWEGMELCIGICAHTYVYVYMQDYIYILFAANWSRSSLQTGNAPTPFLLHTYLHMHQYSLDPQCYTWVCKWRTEAVRAGETAVSRSRHLEWTDHTPELTFSTSRRVKFTGNGNTGWAPNITSCHKPSLAPQQLSFV